jgi:hypothetical protein
LHNPCENRPQDDHPNQDDPGNGYLATAYKIDNGLYPKGKRQVNKPIETGIEVNIKNLPSVYG